MSLMTLLAPHDGKALVFEFGGRRIQPGYHVTEVKAGSFLTLDCGGNPDAWQETILQIEDIPAKDGETFLRVGKFRGILGQVGSKLRLAADARVTIEVSRPHEAMQVYDVGGIDFTETEAVVQLGERPAICKPRHRAELLANAACCAPRSACC
jgi:hypothetical protein